MPTLDLIDGFEHRVVSGYGYGSTYQRLFSNIVNNAQVTVDGTVYKNGAYSLKVAANGAATSVQKEPWASAPTGSIVLSFYWRADSSVADGEVLSIRSSGTIRAYLYISSGNLYASAGGTSQQLWLSSPSADTWYLIDLLLTMPTGVSTTRTLDGRIDGSAKTQCVNSSATGDETANRIVIGTASADTFTHYFDDLVASTDSADYPLGEHGVSALLPTSDGTHNNGSGYIVDGAGGSHTTDFYSLLDEWPPTTGINNADSITQTTASAAEYVEVLFADAAKSNVWGVEAVGAIQSDGTTTNDGALIITDSIGNNLADVWAGDQSDTAPRYQRVIVTEPGGGWTQDDVNDLRARIGFSSNSASDPEWLALMLQYAWGQGDYERAASIDATASIAVAHQAEHERAVSLSASAAITATTITGGYYGGYEIGYALLGEYGAESLLLATASITVAPQRDHLRSVSLNGTATITAAGDIEGLVLRSAAIGADAQITAAGRTIRGPLPYAPLDFPELIVQVDFVNEPNPSADVMPQPVWTDITEHVRVGGFSLRRGRSRSVDRIEAGTLSLMLDNRDRRFDPSYALGPYYPNVQPRRRIRIQSLAETGTTAFHVGDSFVGGDYVLDGGIVLVDLFHGYVDGWQQDYPAQGFDAVAQVTATDMFGLMSEDQERYGWWWTVTWREEMLRLLNLRAYTGKAPTQRDPATGTPLPLDSDGFAIDAENVLIRTVAFYNDYVNMLESVQTLEASGGGAFFIGRDGRPTYRNAATIEEMPDIMPIYGPAGESYSNATRVYDDQNIYNYVTVTVVDGSATTASDANSIARYGQRERQVTTIMYDGTEALDRANAIVDRYKAPIHYINRLEMRNTVENWLPVLRAELWDTVRVQLPLPNGDIYEQVSLIEGIEIASSHARDWTVVWSLSVADPFPNLLTDEQSSFEYGTTTGWSAEDNCTIAASTYTAREGDYAMQVCATGAAGTKVDATVLSDAVSVEASTVYEASAYLYLVGFNIPGGVGGQHLELDWLDSGDSLISTSVGSDASAWSGWRRAEVSAQAPSAAASVQVRIVLADVLVNPYAPGTTYYDRYCAYADDISLRRTL